MATQTENYALHKIDLTDAPPDITVLNQNFDIIDDELKELSESTLKKDGDTMTGSLTVMDNFNVNKTFDSVEYKTYVRPINYSIGSNDDYSTGLIHYKGDTNNAQLMFNKDGVMLRDNVNAKAYQIFGQHNTSLLKSFLLPLDGSVSISGTKLGIFNDKGRFVCDGNGTAIIMYNVPNDGTNRRQIAVYSSDVATNIKNSIKLSDVVNGKITSYNIFGEHNKPSGSYTGNGSATQRTVNIGGVGTTLKISTANGMAFVTGAGAICKKYNATTTYGLPASECSFNDGVLTLATTDTVVNGSRGLHYQVL